MNASPRPVEAACGAAGTSPDRAPVGQLPLLQEPPEPSAHRVRSLAGVLAGFAWPGRGTFDDLRKPQQRAAIELARRTLRDLHLAEQEHP